MIKMDHWILFKFQKKFLLKKWIIQKEIDDELSYESN